jgi:hypothetical protein
LISAWQRSRDGLRCGRTLLFSFRRTVLQ